MDLSIVMPCRNGARTIAEQVLSLAAQRAPGVEWELVVADNGSTDQSVAVVEALADRLPRLKIVDASDHVGAGHARNVGAAHASADRIAFVDADDVAGEGWVQAMAQALDESPFVASRFEGRRLNPDDLVRPLGQSSNLERLWYPPFLPHAGGCGLGIHRRWHEAVGGFDETIRILEDTDYCIRVQKAGAPLVLCIEALMHIRFRRTGGFRQSWRWARGNEMLFARYAPKAPRVEGSWNHFMRSTCHLVRRSRQLRSPPQRSRFIWDLGWHLGVLDGTLRYQVPPVLPGFPRPGHPDS